MEHKEIITVSIDKSLFQEIAMKLNLKAGSDYSIKKVEVPDYPYEESKLWTEQKKKSNAEYRKLKELEFDLRHNV